MQIGSNTKDFTARSDPAVFRRRGKLSMSDTLGRVFSGRAGGQEGHHRSPTDESSRRLSARHWRRLRCIQSCRFSSTVRLCARRCSFSLAHARATRTLASAFLAAIIEQVTGKSYDVYISAMSITAPLGIASHRVPIDRSSRSKDGFAHGDSLEGVPMRARSLRQAGCRGWTVLEPAWQWRNALDGRRDAHVLQGAVRWGQVAHVAQRAAIDSRPDGTCGSRWFGRRELLSLRSDFPGMRSEIIIASTNSAEAPRADDTRRDRARCSACRPRGIAGTKRPRPRRRARRSRPRRSRR